MDTRIEVLAEVILDHAKRHADLLHEGGRPQDADKYRAYRRVEWLCVEVFDALEQYRQSHPEEYETVKRVSRNVAEAKVIT